jgi:hypothetical protein
LKFGAVEVQVALNAVAIAEQVWAEQPVDILLRQSQYRLDLNILFVQVAVAQFVIAQLAELIKGVAAIHLM